MCRKKAAKNKGREWIAGRKEEFIKTQRERKELKRERKEKKVLSGANRRNWTALG